MPALRHAGAGARRSAEYFDDLLRSAGNNITSRTSSGFVKGSALVGGTYAGVKGLGAYETKKESEATRAYAEAYQAIVNDPNLSPAEKDRRIKALRDDFNSGPGSSPGPGGWFERLSYKQIAVWAAILFVVGKTLPTVIGGML